MARPTEYAPEKTAELCARLAQGNSLRQVCAAEDMPGVSTVYLWLAKHPEFVEQYARAREDQADTLADEIVSIADEATNGEQAQVARVRVDARKWVASKLKPKKYGERIESNVKVTGRLEVAWAE